MSDFTLVHERAITKTTTSPSLTTPNRVLMLHSQRNCLVKPDSRQNNMFRDCV